MFVNVKTFLASKEVISSFTTEDLIFEQLKVNKNVWNFSKKLKKELIKAFYYSFDLF